MSYTREEGQGTGSCGCCPEDTSLDRLALIASGACVHGFSGTIANKEIVLNWLTSQGSVQKEKTENPISQLSTERDIFAYFQSCCLRVWLPKSLNLGAD